MPPTGIEEAFPSSSRRCAVALVVEQGCGSLRRHVQMQGRQRELSVCWTHFHLDVLEFYGTCSWDPTTASSSPVFQAHDSLAGIFRGAAQCPGPQP
jgi:hypothetical protein